MKLNQSQQTIVLAAAFAVLALCLFIGQARPVWGVLLCLALAVGAWLIWRPLPGRTVFGTFKGKPGKKKAKR